MQKLSNVFWIIIRLQANTYQPYDMTAANLQYILYKYNTIFYAYDCYMCKDEYKMIPASANKVDTNMTNDRLFS